MPKKTRTQMMLSGIPSALQKVVSQLVYPTKARNWYAEKGYKKNARTEEQFEAFVQAQQGDKATFPYMKEVEAERKSVTATMCDKSKALLDTVTLKPKHTEGKVGAGKHVICFFGRNTPYETRWRELSSDAKNLGATVHAFNFSGFNQSTGNMLEFNGAVNCGIV